MKSIERSANIEPRNCYKCGNDFPRGGGGCPLCREKPARARETAVQSRSLTFRETQIAGLVCEAKLNKEIAFELHLTEGTIKEYLNRIFRKLGVKNRTELAIWAVRNLESAA